MRITKGGVVLTISPSDKKEYVSAGWKVLNTPAKERLDYMNAWKKRKQLKQEGK